MANGSPESGNDDESKAPARSDIQGRRGQFASGWGQFGVSSQYLHQTAVQIRDALTPTVTPTAAAAFEPFIAKPGVARPDASIEISIWR
jgi:hypothetical protein